MRKRMPLAMAGVLLAALLALVALPAQAAPEPDTAVAARAAAKAQQDQYVRFLRERGFSPEIDQNGNVQFRDIDFRYFIDVGAAEGGSFSIVLPALLQVGDDSRRTMAREAIDYVNGRVRAAKLFFVGNQVWVVVEVFLVRPDDFPLVFDRAQLVVASAAYQFWDRMREKMPASGPEAAPRG